MPTGNIQQAEGILKITTGDYTENYETEALVMNRANAGTGKKLGDRGFEIPTGISGNANHGWMTDGGDYPAGGSTKTIRPKVYFKEYVHSVRLTERALQTISPGVAAVKNWKQLNLDDSIAMGYKYNNIYCWGTGSGVLGTISTGANSTTQTLDNNDNVRFLNEGMRISVYDPTLTTLRGSATITSFPQPGATTITLSSAINSTTSDVVTVFGGANQAITGLKAIIDDTTDAGIIFQDTSRNTYRNYRAQLIDAASTGLDVEILNRMIGAKIFPQIGKIDRDRTELWSYTSQTAAYSSLGYNLKRYEGKAKSIDLGYTAYEFQGMNWVEEVDCAKDTVYYIDWSVINKYVASPFGWKDTNGSILKQVPSDTADVAYTAQVEGYWGACWNLGSPDPRKLGRIYGLTVPSGY